MPHSALGTSLLKTGDSSAWNASAANTLVICRLSIVDKDNEDNDELEEDEDDDEDKDNVDDDEDDERENKEEE